MNLTKGRSPQPCTLSQTMCVCWLLCHPGVQPLLNECLQWELDLHGLHVAEALQALHARVELLQEVAQDLKQQVTASANTLAAPAVDRQQPQSQQAIASGAGTSRKQAVLTSLLLPDEQVLSWEQQLAALRQELRVIVGKGLHSSGGEASLPRAVEQWLLQRRYKYIWRGGCIGVQLKLL